jgi:hypothetical protein
MKKNAAKSHIVIKVCGTTHQYVSSSSFQSNYQVNINVPLFLEVRDFMFFYAGKTHNQPFRGVF